MRFRPYPILTIFSIAILVILITLGNWQFGRFEFKRATQNQPPPTVYDISHAKTGIKEFDQFNLKGMPIGDILPIETSQDGKYGNRIFILLNSDIGKVFLELGFIADMRAEHTAQLKTYLQKPIELVVVARKPIKPNRYVSDNRINQKRLFWPEISAMEKIGGNTADLKDFYFTPLVQDPLRTGKPSRNPFADPKGANFIEPERHLGYAITWWGLAIGLIGVYIALHVKNGRFEPKS